MSMFRNHKDIQRTAALSCAHNAQIYNCEICNEGWESETDTFIHKECHKSEIIQWLKEPGNTVCQICVTDQKSYKSLIEHVKTTHLLSSQNARYVEREIFICNICSQIFYNKNMLIIHIARKHWRTKEHTNQDVKMKARSLKKQKEKIKEENLKYSKNLKSRKAMRRQREQEKNKQNEKEIRRSIKKENKDAMQSEIQTRRSTRQSAINTCVESDDDNIKKLQNALEEKGVSLTQIEQSPEDYRIEIIIEPENSDLQSAEAIDNSTEIVISQNTTEIENIINNVILKNQNETENITSQTAKEIQNVTVQNEQELQNIALQTEQPLEISFFPSQNETLQSAKHSKNKTIQYKKEIKNISLPIKKENNATSDNTLLPCPGCEKYIPFRNVWNHLHCHNAASVSICKICFVKYKDTNDLKKHLSTHPAYYRCENCDLNLEHAENFQKHLETHDNLCSKFKLKCTPSLETEEFENKMTAWQFPKLKMFNGLKLHDHLNICILCRCICLTETEKKRHVASHYIAVKTVRKIKVKRNEVCTCGEEFSTNILKKQHLLFNKDHQIVKDDNMEEDIAEAETANEVENPSHEVEFIEDLVPDLESVVNRIFI